MFPRTQECVPPREAIDLMARMLDYNPATRATAEECLQHEWFRMEPRPGPNVFRMPVGRGRAGTDRGRAESV